MDNDTPPPPAKSSKGQYQQFKDKLSDSFKKDKKNADDTEPKPLEGELLPKLSRRQYINEYLKWLKPFNLHIGYIFVLAVIGIAFMMVHPLLTQHIIDNILLDSHMESSQKISDLTFVAFTLLAIIIFGQIIQLTRDYRTTLVNSKVLVAIRRKLFKKMIRLTLSELTEMKTGGAISRLTTDVDRMGNLIMTAIITPTLAVIRLISCIAIVLYINWRLGLIALMILPMMAALSYLWIRRIRPIWKAVNEDNALVSGRLTETFSGIRVVRAFQRERKEEETYTVSNHTILRKTLFARLRIYSMNFFWELVMASTGLLVIVFGGYLVIRGQAQVGEIFAFQMYTFMVLQPVMMIISTMNELQQSIASMERVIDVLRRDDSMPDIPDAKPAPHSIANIRFENVHFGYKDDDMILEDVNIDFEGGKTVAFVGKSGAGKTTMTNLIARFYDPQKGRILLNDIDLRDYKLDEYRGLLGVVQQDVFLFDGTVSDNISYGTPKAERSQIESAAKLANAHEFISEFDDGYDTIIGERGVRLSGGQRQRVSIARAFLSNPKILVLDEATSNLDTESERSIQASLKELMQNRTSFVIAHRLSTITHADLILVIEDGKIIESGSHQQLLDVKGQYYTMIEQQKRLTI